MGAINYGRSEYITLGFRYYDEDDFRNDKDFMDNYMENHLDKDLDLEDQEEELTEYIRDTIWQYQEDDYYNVKYILEQYNFEYFTVKQEPGYYEGSYIAIEFLYSWFDDYKEKMEAYKEVSLIGKCLEECVDVGMVSVYPGWCTSYHDYNTTKKHLKKALAEMRKEVKATECYSTYCKRVYG